MEQEFKMRAIVNRLLPRQNLEFNSSNDSMGAFREKGRSPASIYANCAPPAFERRPSMKVCIRIYLCFLIVCLGFLPLAVTAQSVESDQQRNLSACKSGLGSCDLTRLTQPEISEVRMAEHLRNVSNCRDGRSCDHSQLTQPEANALAVGEHQRNISDCMDGIASCDHARLTPSEAKDVAVAEDQRNVSNCSEGWETC